VTFSLIDDQIKVSDALRTVTRRVPGSRDAVGRFTPEGPITAMVAMDIQTRGEVLDREVPGDRSQGGVNIYVTLAQLAAAYDVNDPGTPLGWTQLELAPADYTEGAPGDRVVFDGRIYEITSEEPFDEQGPLIDPSRRYVAEDRGAA
jgi:hypothetical protein